MNLVPFIEQKLREMIANEAGSAGNKEAIHRASDSRSIFRKQLVGTEGKDGWKHRVSLGAGSMAKAGSAR